MKMRPTITLRGSEVMSHAGNACRSHGRTVVNEVYQKPHQITHTPALQAEPVAHAQKLYQKDSFMIQ
jgi:hypothetical protein